MDAEDVGGLALIAIDVREDFRKQRDFHFAQHDFIEIGIVDDGDIDVGEQLAHRADDMAAEGSRFQLRIHRVGECAGTDEGIFQIIHGTLRFPRHHRAGI